MARLINIVPSFLLVMLGAWVWLLQGLLQELLLLFLFLKAEKLHAKR